MEYRKKPVVIEAFQYDGDLKNSHGNYYVPQWAVKAFESGVMYYDSIDAEPSELFIKTLEGVHHVSVGDYIIQGIQGELCPCKPDIFEKTYDVVTDKINQSLSDPDYIQVESSDLNNAIEKIQEIINNDLLNIETWAEEPYIKALMLALNLLLKRAGRIKGCYYCKDGVYYDVLGTPCKYNYCPICGNPLIKTGDEA